MNTIPEEVTQVQQPSKLRWLDSVRTFLQIPNPAIVKVFVLNCLTTFILGVAFFFEWIFHGKNHIGFGWIIYYALFLMCLPLLILIGLRILMAFSSSSGSNQIVDSASKKEQNLQCTEANQETQEEEEEEETENNNCRSLVVDSDDKKLPRIKRAVSFPSHREVRSCRTR